MRWLFQITEISVYFLTAALEVFPPPLAADDALGPACFTFPLMLLQKSLTTYSPVRYCTTELPF